ncbi:MAG: ABC transporter ATP-binding protein [Candidatus Dormibacteria bacterium]
MLAPETDASDTAQLAVPAVIDAVGVARRYRNGRGVGPLSLEVRGGERIAIMGPNGAGKTTLLRMLSTTARPRDGVVRWYGTTSPRRAREMIGVAPDVVLEEGQLTARQATHFWCRQWKPRHLAPRLVDDALNAFGLDGVGDEPVASFSYGMRRRLALAQALVHEPRIALLDEPTAGLDPDGVERLAAAMQVRAQRGDTTIAATNDCDFASAACDRVTFLDKGHLVHDAAPAALLGSVRSRRVAELELAGAPDIGGLRAVTGVGAVQRDDGVVRVEMLDDSALAAVVAAADRVGELRAVRVHTPDLGDVFHQLTGRHLSANGDTAKVEETR